MRPHCLNRVLAAAAVLLLVGPVLAQVFLPARRIVPAPATVVSVSPTNDLVLWWVFTDEATNEVNLSSWTDRIQSLAATEGTVANQPTNTSRGVRFEVGKRLTHTALSTNDYQSYSVAFIVDLLGDSGFVFSQLWGIASSPPRGFGMGTTNNFMAAWNGFHITFGDPITMHTPQDLIITADGTVGGGNRDIVTYTNGVVSYSDTRGGDANSEIRWSTFGDNTTSVAEFGFIKEVMVWDRALSQSEVDWIHQYRLDLYGNEFSANTAVFDGTNDYMGLTSSAPSGLADGKLFTFSAWVRFDGGDGADQILFGTATAAPLGTLLVRRNTSDHIGLFGRNAAGATILNLEGNTTINSGSGWKHVYVCIDLANASNRKIYIDGVAETLSVTTYTDDTLDLVGANYIYRVGATSTAASKLNGALSNEWWNDSYLDSPSSFASGGKPIYLGEFGELPTGSSPVFYFRGNGNAFNINSGTAPDLTVTGSLGTTTPP